MSRVRTTQIMGAVLVGVVVLLPAAQAEQAPSARAQLQAFSNGLDTLSAQFSQRTLDAAGFVVDEAEGRFYFQAPEQFRWATDWPFEQALVADGERLWHYDESLAQVTVRPQPSASDSPILVLMRPEWLDQFYRIDEDEQAGPNALRFRPLADDAEFNQAELRFVAGQPAELLLIDRFDQWTRITLSDIVRNPSLDADTFRLVVPEGVDVLDGAELEGELDLN